MMRRLRVAGTASQTHKGELRNETATSSNMKDRDFYCRHITYVHTWFCLEKAQVVTWIKVTRIELLQYVASNCYTILREGSIRLANWSSSDLVLRTT